MTKRTLKVLSIDFDYFQNVNLQTLLTSYPDGLDLPTELSSIVWSGHYTNPHDKSNLDKVTINHTELNHLKYILENNCKYTAPILIANSHVHIYDFIIQYMKSYKADCVNIINIDMHHDICNDNPNLDCGNWITHICDAIPNHHISWIANSISREAYAMKEHEFPQIETSIESIKNCKFDIVFLCRSDNWFAPHLDCYFQELIDFMQTQFHSIQIENCVRKPRNIKEWR